MRHGGLHIEWSHIWSLLNWNEKYNNTNEWMIQHKMWLDGLRCEDSKERLRGTKQGWRASDGLAAEEPS